MCSLGFPLSKNGSLLQKKERAWLMSLGVGQIFAILLQHKQVHNSMTF